MVFFRNFEGRNEIQNHRFLWRILRMLNAQYVHWLGAVRYYAYAKFIRQNIAKHGSFFLIHFDSLSQEQSILMRQWKRVFPTFTNIDEQSPSKQVIDKTLLELDTKGEITLSINHLQGDAIHYESEDEVLETFMNFHLETYFNDSPLTENVIEDIKEQASKYRNEDGSYDITPGCYVYLFVKN